MRTLLAVIFACVLFVGCQTTEIHSDEFSDDEYVWETWSVSTNTISIIDVKFDERSKK